MRDRAPHPRHLRHRGRAFLALAERIPPPAYDGPGWASGTCARSSATSRSLVTVATYLPTRAETVAVASPAAYFAAVSRIASVDDDGAIARRGVDAGRALGRRSGRRAAGVLCRRDRGAGRPRRADPVVETIAGGMRVSDYLPDAHVRADRALPRHRRATGLDFAPRTTHSSRPSTSRPRVRSSSGWGSTCCSPHRPAAAAAELLGRALAVSGQRAGDPRGRRRSAPPGPRAARGRAPARWSRRARPGRRRRAGRPAASARRPRTSGRRGGGPGSGTPAEASRGRCPPPSGGRGTVGRDRAHRVQPDVLRSAPAGAVAVEAGHRVGAARFQRPAEDVPLAHRSVPLRPATRCRDCPWSSRPASRGLAGASRGVPPPQLALGVVSWSAAVSRSPIRSSSRR